MQWGGDAGAMFAKVIQKTNISDAIIKKAAELSGDKPIALATLMTAAAISAARAGAKVVLGDWGLTFIHICSILSNREER